jgi:ankyrin repeat protein
LGLLDELLDAGACIDGAPGGWNPLVAALHNGRGEAAEFLARRGARLDLEGAAGIGRVDVVARYLNEDGMLQDGATAEQLNYGLIWACEYGKTNVVKFLLEKEISIDWKFFHGQTGLHWAAYGGHAEIVDLLLKAGAPVNIKDQRHGSTPLEWAIYGWSSPAPEFKNARHHEAVESLFRAGATLEKGWIESPNRSRSLQSKLRADPRMMAALGL